MNTYVKYVLLIVFMIGQQLAFSQNRPFITTWTTTTDAETISISLNSSFNYDFTFVWKNESDGNPITSGTHSSTDGAFETTLPTVGNYILEITGQFPHLQDYPKSSLTDVNQWGDIDWKSFDSSFKGWAGDDFSAVDVPNLSAVTSLQKMFEEARAFNGDISTWDVGNVTNMADMFFRADVFEGDLSQWNVENVTDMQGMFAEALAFNSNLNSWNVGKVVNMRAMFTRAGNFNQDISACGRA